MAEFSGKVAIVAGVPVSDLDAEIDWYTRFFVQNCEGCHGMTRQRLRYWRALSDTAMSKCLTDLSVATPSPRAAMIDCVRAMPDVADLRLRRRRSSASTRPRASCRGSSSCSGARTATTARPSSPQFQAARSACRRATRHAAHAGAVRHRRRVVRARRAAARRDAADRSAAATCTPGISADVAAHVDRDGDAPAGARSTART